MWQRVVDSASSQHGDESREVLTLQESLDVSSSTDLRSVEASGSVRKPEGWKWFQIYSDVFDMKRFDFHRDLDDVRKLHGFHTCHTLPFLVHILHFLLFFVGAESIRILHLWVSSHNNRCTSLTVSTCGMGFCLLWCFSHMGQKQKRKWTRSKCCFKVK